MNFVQALVAFGADVNLPNNYDLTPADVAKLADKTDILKFLKDVGGKERGEQRPHLPIQEQNQPMEVGDENADSMRDEGPGLFGGRSPVLHSFSTPLLEHIPPCPLYVQRDAWFSPWTTAAPWPSFSWKY